MKYKLNLFKNNNHNIKNKKKKYTIFGIYAEWIKQYIEQLDQILAKVSKINEKDKNVVSGNYPYQYATRLADLHEVDYDLKTMDFLEPFRSKLEKGFKQQKYILINLPLVLNEWLKDKHLNQINRLRDAEKELVIIEWIRLLKRRSQRKRLYKLYRKIDARLSLNPNLLTELEINLKKEIDDWLLYIKSNLFILEHLLYSVSKQIGKLETQLILSKYTWSDYLDGTLPLDLVYLYCTKRQQYSNVIKYKQIICQSNAYQRLLLKIYALQEKQLAYINLIEKDRRRLSKFKLFEEHIFKDTDRKLIKDKGVFDFHYIYDEEEKAKQEKDALKLRHQYLLENKKRNQLFYKKLDSKLLKLKNKQFVIEDAVVRSLSRSGDFLAQTGNITQLQKLECKINKVKKKISLVTKNILLEIKYINEVRFEERKIALATEEKFNSKVYSLLDKIIFRDVSTIQDKKDDKKKVRALTVQKIVWWQKKLRMIPWAAKFLEYGFGFINALNWEVTRTKPVHDERYKKALFEEIVREVRVVTQVQRLLRRKVRRKYEIIDDFGLDVDLKLLWLVSQGKQFEITESFIHNLKPKLRIYLFSAIYYNNQSLRLFKLLDSLERSLGCKKKHFFQVLAKKMNWTINLDNSEDQSEHQSDYAEDYIDLYSTVYPFELLPELSFAKTFSKDFYNMFYNSCDLPFDSLHSKKNNKLLDEVNNKKVK